MRKKKLTNEDLLRAIEGLSMKLVGTSDKIEKLTVGICGEIRGIGGEIRGIGSAIDEIGAKIENITGYSSHKDSDHLVEFVASASEKGKLKKVFVIMGEPKSSLFLVQRLRDYLEVEAIYPEAEKPYEL